MTTRDDFLLELGDALGGQASVRPVESVSAALEHLVQRKRGQVLIVDSRDSSGLREEVELAHTRAPHAVILVFATADQEKQVGSEVKGSTVFAVLPIPMDVRKTAAVFESVMADAVARLESAPKSEPGARMSSTPRTPSTGISIESFQPPAQSPPAPAADSTDGSDPGDAGKRVMLIAAGVVGAAAIAAAAIWLFSRGNSRAALAPAGTKPAVAALTAGTAAADAAPLSARPVVETLVKGNVDELLEKARLAMRERRYTQPTGDNALLYYRSAAAADAGNAEALDGLQRVASVLASRFDEAMTSSHFDEAALALANLKSAAPKDARLAPLELRLDAAQISKALADGNIERAGTLLRQAQASATIPAEQLGKWRTEIARHQEDAKIQRLAGLVSDRIHDGKLADASGDNAKAYMQQLREASPANAATQRVQHELNMAYLHKAREAGLARNTQEADRWLGEAKAGGATASEITAFQRDLSTARQKAAAVESERFAQLTRERMRDGKLTEPAQDSAAFYLSQLQAGDPSNGAVATMSRDLASKLIDRARSAARDPARSSQVDADLVQARRWGADARDIQVVQQLQSASRTAAAQSHASQQRSNAASNPLANQLKRTRYTAPEYPNRALSDKLSGVVTIEFTVGTKGEPRDIRVTDASPPGVFEHSAIAAVKRWRYEPVVSDGKPIEIPVRTSIRFELPK